MPSKWFCSAGFGHCYLAAVRVWVASDIRPVLLDKNNQTGFRLEVDRAVRTYEIDGKEVVQSYFVPNHLEAFTMTLDAEDGSEFIVEPQFDMRYYQAFNTDFSRYGFERFEILGRHALRVENHVDIDSSATQHLDFFAIVAPLSDGVVITEVAPEQRLRQRTYLKDEHRQKLIHSAYRTAGEKFADEAPIWDEYSTSVYVPARLSGRPRLELLFTFGDRAGEAEEGARRVRYALPALTSSKKSQIDDLVERGSFSSGLQDIDLAYRQVLARFDDALVARDMRVKIAGRGEDLNAVFAGNKYFLDAWKRDENISLIALLLTGDFETVRAILNDTWRFQDPRTGRLPHIIRLGEPLVYYSSDGTLWALDRLWRYTVMSGDESLLAEKYRMVEQFFEASLGFVKRGLLPSGGIIEKGYLWETWMDTPYTPRAGYPVEIELLWLTALKNFQPAIAERNPELAERLEKTRVAGLQTFKLFYLDGYLADSLGYDWNPQAQLTPNGYIAFALDFPLPAELASAMIQMGRGQLAGRVGIRSLAPRDWPKVFSPEFMADPDNFRGSDMASVGVYNYHRGIEWPWLNPFFVAAELHYGDPRHAFARYVRGVAHEARHEGGLGGVSELYDIQGPLGADFQAWSMAGFVASLHEFAGINVDARKRVVSVRPVVPSGWPGLSVRRRVASSFFTVNYRGEGSRQSIALDFVDSGGHAGYNIAFGVRLPSPAPQRVEVNGQPVPPGSVELRDVTDEITEAWVTSEATGQMRVVFEPESAP